MMETKWRGVALAVFPPAMLEVFDDEATILDSCNIMRKPSALVVRPEKYLADAALHYNNPCLTINACMRMMVLLLRVPFESSRDTCPHKLLEALSQSYQQENPTLSLDDPNAHGLDRSLLES
ncbi:hypothetical protein WJX84_007043 [Apatococcus fuscideae]|uniref:Uncharacterized protein n=1 Tax=Apatococcus fuscideae TaxID=2026836 RepID=A0AAW1S7E4_9CHLO